MISNIIKKPIYQTSLLLVSLTFTVNISGCSAKSIYQTLQNNARLDCEKEPPSTYDECLAQHKTRYERYKQQRDQLLEENQ